jgi:glucosamine--fructose-6-phosphate aminotransferase (isomerizing)
MCGIIAYFGDGDAVKNVADGLLALEYRGYDSAGIAYIEGEKIKSIKSVGAVDRLLKRVADAAPPPTKIAIGHTRWATHGGVTEANCHPHLSMDGTVAVVHNGIIENHQELRADLISRGFVFGSQTDTEIIPNLIAAAPSRTLLERVQSATQKLDGSYAFIAISTRENEIVAVKHGNQPIVIGVSKNEIFVSSDTPTATKYGKLFALEDGESARISADGVEFFAGIQRIKKSQLRTDTTLEMPDKGAFKTFMEKEIAEIPAVVGAIRAKYGIGAPAVPVALTNSTPVIPAFSKIAQNSALTLETLRAKIHSAETVRIVACGTSYHAGLYIAHLLESVGVPARAYIASEFQCIKTTADPRDVAIVISQSGETADTIAAMKILKQSGIFTVAICNVAGSSIWRYADFALPTYAGTEVAVASTKAFIAQSLVGEILVFDRFLYDYENVATEVLKQKNEIKIAARKFKSMQKIFFLGVGATTYIAAESALKVKEVTYRHCEGLPAGELKHGTLAMVDDKTLSIMLPPDGDRQKSRIQNATAEIAARGGRIWELPPTGGVMSVIYAQLFALYMCYELNLDPDKPRNLAKSVTVG